MLTTVNTVSRWPSPDSIQAKGCRECFGLRDHIRMLESADAEANKVGSTGEILRSITSYTHKYQSHLRWSCLRFTWHLHLHDLLMSDADVSLQSHQQICELTWISFPCLTLKIFMVAALPATHNSGSPVSMSFVQHDVHKTSSGYNHQSSALVTDCHQLSDLGPYHDV